MFIIMDANTTGDFFQDQDYAVVVPVSSALVSRIKELAAAVESVDAYAIQEFCYELWVVAGGPDEYFDWGGEGEDDEMDATCNTFYSGEALYETHEPAWVPSKRVHVDVPMLRVTKDDYMFSFVPHHGTHVFETSMQRISILLAELQEA